MRLESIPSRVALVHNVGARSLADLSPEDLGLLRLLAEGMPLDAIARRLATSERTVRRRTRLICDRIGVTAPIQAVVWAVRHRLI